MYDGNYNEGEIPLDLYFKTADKLAKAVIKGLGTKFEYNDPANMLGAQLKSNLYQFSGAKSLTEALMFSEKIADENGFKKPFSKYQEEILKIHKDYNVRYLSAEYDNAVAQSQMALKWMNFVEIGAEWLEIRTAGDARVRPEHAKLEGLVFNIKSPVFYRIPPFDWACRCTLVPADKPANPMSDAEGGKIMKGVVTNPVFENNPGITKLIYNDKHPYFKSYSGLPKQLDAIKNYGMKPVDKMLQQTNLPAQIHLDTEADYLKWWNDMVNKFGVENSDFVITDKIGTKVLFDASPNGKNKTSYFRDHIIQKKNEKRFEYAANLQDILENPDEIWSGNYLGRTPSMTYVKYYDGNAIVVNATIGDSSIKAETMFTLDNAKSKIDTRKGILMYKK